MCYSQHNATIAKEKIMNLKIVVPLVLVSLGLGACGSTDKFERRAELERERRQEAVKEVLSEAPDWMTKLPDNTPSVVYASGTAASDDFNMALGVARTNAMEGLCMAAGGRVKSQTKVFRNDSANKSNALNTTAIKTICPAVDITGAEVVDSKLIPEYGRYRAYVLTALPIGEANQLKRNKVGDYLAGQAVTKREQEFKELDQESDKLNKLTPLQ